MQKEFKCSFCGKNQDQVERLIAGPGVYICAECVKIFTDTLNVISSGDKPHELTESEISAITGTVQHTSKKPLKCSFCGKNEAQVQHLLSGPNVYICGECLNLCIEIIEEEKGHTVEQREQRKEEKIIKFFNETNAIMEGHFILSSGFHSEKYIQCAKALQYPVIAHSLSITLGDKFISLNPEVVIGPALGAVTLAYEMARRLGSRALFTERENGKMTLRRGFEIKGGESVLVVEDVLTTGGSVKEVVEVVRAHGGNVVGVGTLVDRSDGKLDLGVPVHALLKISVEKYQPEDCPLCKQGIPLVKPGSKRQY